MLGAVDKVSNSSTGDTTASATLRVITSQGVATPQHYLGFNTEGSFGAGEALRNLCDAHMRRRHTLTYSPLSAVYARISQMAGATFTVGGEGPNAGGRSSTVELLAVNNRGVSCY